jgi:SRSO17 transposase
VLSRLPRNAPAWLDRLSVWLEPFEVCFTHIAQRGAFRRYLLGLLSDSRRKSMSAMLERVSDAGTYQAFQHFITDAPWSADRVWRQLRAGIPERRGILILDGTSFPKQGRHSVAVARQYCGALGKVANCQVAVTAALWTGVRAWMLGAALYLPKEWLTPDARQRGRIPATIRFQEKWRLALTLLRQIRAAGFEITAVLGDAEFGNNATLRRTLHRLQLPYALGISSTLTVFRGTPAVAVPPKPPGRSRPPSRLQIADRSRPVAVRLIAAALPATAWLRALVRLAHHRWAIEQQYLELKDELGLDHFEGRSFVGWHRHVVLTALAYAWLQDERRRAGARVPTLPVARAVITEILTAHFFVTRPHYLRTMQKLAEINLRI